MLLTIIKALEVDFKNADDKKYLRSDTNISQNLGRILGIRKHYPEFNAQQTLLFPKLAELSKLTRAEGLCLSYWHEYGEINEFKSALGHRSESDEAAVLAARPSRFKVASLSRFMQRNEDAVLLSFLTDVALTNKIRANRKVFTTQEHRQQITGMLYNLHLLDEQLHTMITRQSPRIDFAPAAAVIDNRFGPSPQQREAGAFLSNNSEPHNLPAHNRDTRYSAPVNLQKYNVMPDLGPSVKKAPEHRYIASSYTTPHYAEVNTADDTPKITPVRSKNDQNAAQPQIIQRSSDSNRNPNFVPPISFDNGPIPASQQSTSGVYRTAIDSSGPIDIWYNLAEDPRTPQRFLMWLSENKNEYVAQRAVATLKKQELERATVQQFPQRTPISNQIFAS